MNVSCRRPAVRWVAELGQQRGEGAVGHRVGEELRPDPQGASGRVPRVGEGALQVVEGQAGAQLDRGGHACPVDELPQQVPGRSLVEGGGAEEGGLDRCAGLGLQGEVDGELVRGVRCPGLPGRDQVLERDVRPVRLDAGGHRLGDGVEPQ